MLIPSRRARGNDLVGFLVSSAMLTESSKPTIAKNASAVAEVTASSGVVSGSNLTSRPGSGSMSGLCVPVNRA